MADKNLGTPSGTRDFSPVEVIRRQFILETLKNTFERFGFQPLETPALENISTLTGKYGDEGDKLLFRVLNSGDYLSKSSSDDYEKGYQHLSSIISKRGLRYDLTVPLARFVAKNRGNLVFPFKRYQIQPVWRADRPQKGRYREFFQCDIDVIGSSSLLCEAELIYILVNSFTTLNLPFKVYINNRKILSSVAEKFSVKEKENELCVALDKLDKKGWDGVQLELEKSNFSKQTIDSITGFLDKDFDDNKSWFEFLKGELSSTSIGAEGVEELESVYNYLDALEVSTERVVFNPVLARGLSYYTGVILETICEEGHVGSISGGGRYENLTEVFGVSNLPGVGVSFGIDRIYDLMESLDLFPKDLTSTSKLLLTGLDESSLEFALKTSNSFRGSGINTEVYFEPCKLKKAMTYANNKSIPFVGIIGGDELSQQKINLKNMVSGEQSLLSVDEAIQSIRSTGA